MIVSQLDAIVTKMLVPCSISYNIDIYVCLWERLNMLTNVETYSNRIIRIVWSYFVFGCTIRHYPHVWWLLHSNLFYIRCPTFKQCHITRKGTLVDQADFEILGKIACNKIKKIIRTRHHFSYSIFSRVTVTLTIV